MILALRSRFDAVAADGLHARYELRLGEDRFRITMGEELEVTRGELDQADARITTDPDTLAAVLWGQASLTDAQRSETMTIEGDTTAAKRFFRLFPLHEPAAAVSAS